MTSGADGMTLNDMTTARINRIIASMKDRSYQPKPARRVYIAKQNNPAKQRPPHIVPKLCFVRVTRLKKMNEAQERQMAGTGTR